MLCNLHDSKYIKALRSSLPVGMAGRGAPGPLGGGLFDPCWFIVFCLRARLLCPPMSLFGSVDNVQDNICNQAT